MNNCTGHTLKRCWRGGKLQLNMFSISNWYKLDWPVWYHCMDKIYVWTQKVRLLWTYLDIQVMAVVLNYWKQYNGAWKSMKVFWDFISFNVESGVLLVIDCLCHNRSCQREKIRVLHCSFNATHPENPQYFIIIICACAAVWKVTCPVVLSVFTITLVISLFSFWQMKMQTFPLSEVIVETNEEGWRMHHRNKTHK